MPLRPLLIIEEDVALRSALSAHLNLAGDFLAEEVDSFSQAAANLAEANKHYIAILMNVGSSNSYGRDFCAKLRCDGHGMPIIMLADEGTAEAVVSGLDAGANDYIVKPFRPRELVARIQAHIRTFDNSNNAIFVLGPYLFRPTARLLIDSRGKRRIGLTGTECSILKCLSRANGELVPRETLLTEIWNSNSAVYTHTLETHVWRLRQKIELGKGNDRLLPASRGGYKLGPAAFAYST